VEMEERRKEKEQLKKELKRKNKEKHVKYIITNDNDTLFCLS
jgi:hypothetical protein